MRLLIKDIRYNNNGKGKYNTSKVGKKYDMRKNHEFDFYPNMHKVGENLHIYFDDGNGIITTPYVKSYFNNEKFIIKTINSIYVCEVIND